MKKRFGGILAIALGALLIGNGLSQSGDGSVGTLPPDTTCGSKGVGALTAAGDCPVGAVYINDTTPSSPGAPTDWDVRVTSPCRDPFTGLPVDKTLTVPVNTTRDSGARIDVYIFTEYDATASSPKCSYTLTREVNPLFTATFTPASPVTVPFSDDDTASSDRFADVKLVNTRVAETTSASVTTSTSTVPSTPTDESGSSSSAAESSAASGSASDSAAAAPIAETGPRESITVTLWLGLGLVLLGLVLLFEGRIRRFGKHHG